VQAAADFPAVACWNVYAFWHTYEFLSSGVGQTSLVGMVKTPAGKKNQCTGWGRRHGDPVEAPDVAGGWLNDSAKPAFSAGVLAAMEAQ